MWAPQTAANISTSEGFSKFNIFNTYYNPHDGVTKKNQVNHNILSVCYNKTASVVPTFLEKFISLFHNHSVLSKNYIMKKVEGSI